MKFPVTIRSGKTEERQKILKRKPQEKTREILINLPLENFESG